MDFDELIANTLNQKKTVLINNKFYLTVDQIEILKKYQIPYESCNSINEIIYYMEEILEEGNDYEDLEQVSLSLAENDYYQNYRK